VGQQWPEPIEPRLDQQRRPQPMIRLDQSLDRYVPFDDEEVVALAGASRRGVVEQSIVGEALVGCVVDPFDHDLIMPLGEPTRMRTPIAS
jgi:hypothetical protein